MGDKRNAGNSGDGDDAGCAEFANELAHDFLEVVCLRSVQELKPAVASCKESGLKYRLRIPKESD